MQKSDTPGSRLRQARLDADFKTRAAAARAKGLHAHNLGDHEHGRRIITPAMGQRYAKAFSCSPSWILYGHGSQNVSAGQIAIMGYVGAGAEVFPVDDGSVGEIDTPPGCQEGDVAFVIRGDSQYPFRDRGVIVARPVSTVHEVVNRLAVVDLEDGRRLFKQVTHGAAPATFNLLSHNAAPIMGVTVIRAALFRAYVEP